MEKRFGIKVIVLQESLKRRGLGRVKMRLVCLLIFIIGELITIHAVVSQRDELRKIFFERI